VVGELWGSWCSPFFGSGEQLYTFVFNYGWMDGGPWGEALAKKSPTRSNSFFPFFIFWGQIKDFKIFFWGP
jgi:hypothetical protein